MRTSSAKAKGRRAQQEVRDAILRAFPELTDRDVESVSMGSSGEDIKLSQAAFDRFPFAVEVKNQERLNIWDSLKQAERDARSGTPLLAFKRNRSDVYVALRLEDFLKAVGGRS